MRAIAILTSLLFLSSPFAFLGLWTGESLSRGTTFSVGDVSIRYGWAGAALFALVFVGIIFALIRWANRFTRDLSADESPGRHRGIFWFWFNF
jgi:hypothetical protein